MAQYIVGDLLQLFRDKRIDLMAHGCNCRGVMGAGIARLIAAEWPEVVQADRGIAHQGITNLGMACPVTVGGDRTIVNLYTQFEPGPNAEYAAIRGALVDLGIGMQGASSKIKQFFKVKTYNMPTLYIPLIGCGIGGLDPVHVGEVVDDAAQATRIRIVFVVLPKEVNLVPKSGWIQLDESLVLQ